MLRIKPFYVLALILAVTLGSLVADAQAAKGTVDIETLKTGDGDVAVNNAKVTVHYTGWLKDGTKFDSSVDRGTPFEFDLGAGQVIPGWDIGVRNMKIGEKRRLTIPPHLGYGARGAGAVIPPNATLVFDIELIAVEPPKYSNIDNPELKGLLARGVRIIDIRRQDEWEKTGLIEGSQRLTAFDAGGKFDPAFITRLAALSPAKEAVIFICRAGNRSAVIANFLSKQRGYETVYNVSDGIEKWIKDGLPVVK